MKILFKVLDYSASVFMGAGTVLVVSLLIPAGMNMVLAMIAGMMLGTAVLFLGVMIFSFVSAPFELFPAGMIITMIIGMGSAMAVASWETDPAFMLRAGIAFSLFVQLMIDLYNLKIRGEVHIDR